MSELTRDEVLASIIPKSDQLNADDLVAGPITVTITGVKRGDREQPMIVEIEGRRPYKPCKTMRRVLVATFGADTSAWVGQQATLYCDQSVTWAGVKVGGIRISHLSTLTEPRPFVLTQARGKRVEVVIQPLSVLTDAERAFVAETTKAIGKAATMEELSAIAAGVKGKPKQVQDAVRPSYAKRKQELSA